MEKYGVPGMAHPHTGVHQHRQVGEHINVRHNIEQPKGPHAPAPKPVNHTGHHPHRGHPGSHTHHSNKK